MFSRRLAPEGSSSPPSLSQQPSSESGTVAPRQATIEDTDGINISIQKKHGKLS